MKLTGLWNRGQRKSDPPRGVRIEHADGTVSECELVRDPHDGPGRVAQWIALPPDGTVLAPGDALSIDVLPPRTSVLLGLPLRRETGEAGMSEAPDGV